MHDGEYVSWNTDIQAATTSEYEFWQWIITNPLEVIHKLGYIEGDIWCMYHLMMRGVPLDITLCGCYLMCHQWRELTPYEKEITRKFLIRNTNDLMKGIPCCLCIQGTRIIN